MVFLYPMTGEETENQGFLKEMTRPDGQDQESSKHPVPPLISTIHAHRAIHAVARSLGVPVFSSAQVASAVRAAKASSAGLDGRGPLPSAGAVVAAIHGPLNSARQSRRGGRGWGRRRNSREGGGGASPPSPNMFKLGWRNGIRDIEEPGETT